MNLSRSVLNNKSLIQGQVTKIERSAFITLHHKVFRAPNEQRVVILEKS